MNGPEHYAEAERIVDSASLAPNPRDQHVLLAAAQVHATLALVAAASETTYRAGDRERWAPVLAVNDETP